MRQTKPIKRTRPKRRGRNNQTRDKRETGPDLDAWKPRTELGRKVKAKEILSIDEILDSGKAILESEIVDSLLTLESDLLLIGQAKGKFGGGQRRTFRQTQKKTMEGNKPKFSALAVVGDKDGHVGLGLGSAKETLPAREKAIKQAKLNIFKIRRGTGSWEDSSSESHSIPFAVEGKSGSVIVKLLPAPKGKGLIIEKEAAKVLALAGVKNVWSKTFGQTKKKINFIKALEIALRKLSTTRVLPKHKTKLAIIEGTAPKNKISAKEFEEVAVVKATETKSEPKTKKVNKNEGEEQEAKPVKKKEKKETKKKESTKSANKEKKSKESKSQE